MSNCTCNTSVKTLVQPPAPRQRPEVVRGATHKIRTGYGTMYVTVNSDEDDQPFEVFATLGKSGSFFQAKSEAICRLVSLSLRSGIAVTAVIDQLRGIRGPAPIWTKTGQVLSIPDAIAQILTQYTTNQQGQLQLEIPHISPSQDLIESLTEAAPPASPTTHRQASSTDPSDTGSVEPSTPCLRCGVVLIPAAGETTCQCCEN